MAAVKVVRFKVLRNGKEYGPGAIIRDLTDKEAEKLVKESGGEIEAVEVVVEKAEDAEAAEPKEDKPAKAKKG